MAKTLLEMRSITKEFPGVKALDSELSQFGLRIMRCALDHGDTQKGIEQLRAEVKKHNNLIERVFHLESRADRHDDEFKRVNARLTDLEKEERE